jgi:tRNA A37 threonylcarbamoyladenosine dehydratase
MALLTGEPSLAALERARVAVIGLGGVGSWAAEALARSGLGRLTIIDNDKVSPSNINRQLQALPNTVGLPKAASLMRRLRDVNPRCDITAFNQIFSRETAHLFGLAETDYVIDAIDSLPHKLDLIMYIKGEVSPSLQPPSQASLLGAFSATPSLQRPVLFSSMGMAQKLDPTRIKTADIWNTRGCPLARLVRHGLRERGFSGHFTAVYSDELLPRTEAVTREPGSAGAKIINGSAVTVTAAAGMILASLVIRDICARVQTGESPAADDGGNTNTSGGGNG